MDRNPQSTNSDSGFKDDQNHNDVSKKRKAFPRWRVQERDCSENGLEEASDDGYSWRKYAITRIWGPKFPSSYYKCTYHGIQGCLATKRVQRSVEDPTIFEITYKGSHTCNKAAQSIASAEYNHHQQQQSNESLLNFRTNLRINTGDLDSQEMTSPMSISSASFASTSENQLCTLSPRVSDSILGRVSTSFVSQATSGSKRSISMSSISHATSKSKRSISPSSISQATSESKRSLSPSSTSLATSESNHFSGSH